MTKKISNRTFGVEIETVGLTEEEIYLLFKKNNIPATTFYRGSKSPRWRITYDSSLIYYKNDDAVAEIISPILSGTKGLREVQKICTVLQKAGVKVNRSCGLHVHVGAKDLYPNEIITILSRYKQYEDLIDKFVHTSRRKNKSEFSKSMPSIPNVKEFQNMLLRDYLDDLEYYKNRLRSNIDIGCSVEEIKLLENKIKKLKSKTYSMSDIQNFFAGRYYKINTQSYDEIGTIEFRQHHGSINPKTVTNWIKFVLNFVEQSRNCTKEINFKKNNNAVEKQYKKLYNAFKRAPIKGLTKERISFLLGINVRSVNKVLFNMSSYHRGVVVPHNGRYFFEELPYTKVDRGPLMGLPKPSKTFFLERSKQTTRKLSDWV